MGVRWGKVPCRAVQEAVRQGVCVMPAVMHTSSQKKSTKPSEADGTEAVGLWLEEACAVVNQGRPQHAHQ